MIQLARVIGAERSTYLIELLTHKTRRALLFTMLGMPATLLMVAWKAALFVLAPSLFLLATVLFTLGVAVAKVGIIRSHIRLRKREINRENIDAVTHQRLVYRTTGVVVTILSALYTVSFLPMLVGRTHEIRYDRNVAIIIAAITFAEIGLAVHGAISARRNHDQLTEAVKLTNLAGACVLLTLTQSALLSIEPNTDIGNANALSGLVFGSLATGVGGWMLWRSRVAGQVTAKSRRGRAVLYTTLPSPSPRTTHHPRSTHVGRLARRCR